MQRPHLCRPTYLAGRLPALTLALVGAGLAVPAMAQAEMMVLHNAESSNTAPLAVAFHGAEYFVGGAGQFRGLYRTAGPQATTKLVARIPGRDPGYFSTDAGLAVVRDQLVFTAYSSYYGTGFLMRSDGTAAGTRRVLKGQGRAPATRKGADKLSVSAPIVAGDELFVDVAGRGEKTTLSRVDLANGSLAAVLGKGRGGLPIAATSGSGLIFSTAGSSGKAELWNAPPTGAPVSLAPTERRTAYGATPSYAAAGEQLYFTGTDAAHGAEPWVTDGTPAGTHLVADLTPGAASSDISALRTVQGSVYAAAAPAAAGLDAPHTPYLLTGPPAPAPVTFEGAPALIGTRSDSAGVVPPFATDDALWFAVGSGAALRRVRVGAGATVGEAVPGAPTDETGALIVPGRRFSVVANTVRTTDAAGISTILATTGLALSGRDGPEPAITRFGMVGPNAWFKAPAADAGPSVLWRSDGTVAGTGPVTNPGQIDPVASTSTIVVSPRRARRAPYRFTLTGTITPTGILPSTAAQLCTGTVTLTVSRSGVRRVLGRQRLKVRWNGTTCGYRRTIEPSKDALRVGRGHLSIGAQFSGNAHVTPPGAAKRRVDYPQ